MFYAYLPSMTASGWQASNKSLSQSQKERRYRTICKLNSLPVKPPKVLSGACPAMGSAVPTCRFAKPKNCDSTRSSSEKSGMFFAGLFDAKTESPICKIRVNKSKIP